MTTKHCMTDYNELEQRLTCVKCGHPLAYNKLVKDAYKSNTTNSWAKGQLNILADMAEDRGQTIFAEKIRHISNELRLL